MSLSVLKLCVGSIVHVKLTVMQIKPLVTVSCFMTSIYQDARRRKNKVIMLSRLILLEVYIGKVTVLNPCLIHSSILNVFFS